MRDQPNILVEFKGNRLVQSLSPPPNERRKTMSSKAMKRAHEIREETGADMSSALTEAWDEIRGKTKFETSQFSKLLLIIGAGLGIYYLIKREFPWTTWQLGKQRKLVVLEAQRITRQKNSPVQFGHVTELRPRSPDGSEEPISIIEP